MSNKRIVELLGAHANDLLTHTCKTIKKEDIHLPGADFVDRSFAGSNRTPQVLRSLQQLYGTGRLANTGYMSILPVDQGIEHSAGASFAPNPLYFDSENIVKLALEGGCNAVASTYGVLASVARAIDQLVLPYFSNQGGSEENSLAIVSVKNLQARWGGNACVTYTHITCGSNSNRVFDCLHARTVAVYDFEPPMLSIVSGVAQIFIHGVRIEHMK